MIILFTFDTAEDTDKFIYIYNHYLKTVYYTIKKFTNDPCIIEDLSQDVFTKLAENLSHIDLNLPNKARNYIITITRNHCKNHLQSQSKVKEESWEEWINKHENCTSKSDGLLNIVIKNESKRIIIEEISRLSDIYQTVLELKYFIGFNNDEIAHFLNIEKKTVEMRLYRANKILQNKLKDFYNEY